MTNVHNVVNKTAAVVGQTASFWREHLPAIIAIGSAVAFGIFGSAILRWLIRALSRWSERRNRHLRAGIFDVLSRPLIAALWGIAIYFIALSLAEPFELAGLLRILPIALKAYILIVIAWGGLRVTAKVEHSYPEHARTRRGHAPDPMLVDTLGKIARILIVTIIGLMMLRVLNFSIESLLAFGGVAGIAVGFAAQGVTANLFGALVVYIDQPFKVGEWIVLPAQNVFGTVEHIGWRTTMLRGFDTRPYYVPNQVFNSSVVQTPPRMQARRINETISIRYADFDKLPGIVEECRRHVEKHPDVEHSQGEMVYFSKYGNHALEIMIYCFARTMSWKDSLAIQEKLLIELGEIVRSHGAQLALPITQVDLNARLPFDLETMREQAQASPAQ